MMNTYKAREKVLRSLKGKGHIIAFILAMFTYGYAYSQPLSGTKTIDPGGSGSNNYTSFNAAINALQSNGVNGPVVFEVAAGTYNGQVSIGSISGASSKNTITFDGGDGNASTRILRYNANSTTNAYVVRFDNARYVTFRNLTIENTGTGAGLGVHVYNSSNDCHVEKCHIKVNTTSTSRNFKAVQITNSTDVTDGSYCGGSGANPYNIYLDSNEIEGGYYSIYAVSRYNNTSLEHILYVRHNRILQPYEGGVGIANVRGYDISYNYIEMRSGNTTAKGFEHCNGGTGGQQRYSITFNEFVNCSQYGIQYQTANSNGANARIWNNFFRGSWTNNSAQAIRLGYMRNTEVWANTIEMSNNLDNDGAGIYAFPSGYANDFKNNNIVLDNPSTSGLCFNAEGGTINNSDYNNYYKANQAPGQFLIALNGTKLFASGFKGFSGLETNSHSVNPNLDKGKATPGILCLSGTTISQLPKDLYGQTRNNPPTVGAAESGGGDSLDASVSSLLQPSFPISAGSQDFLVRIKNEGFTTLTSVDVNVDVNGTVKTINWTGSLIPCDTASIAFSGSNQVTLSSGKNVVKVYVGNPNTGSDQNNLNDTLELDLCTPMSGTYTIDPSGGGDYLTINEAIEELSCAGVGGAVTFDLVSGTHIGFANLLFIQGVSATNTITIKGAGASSTTLFNDGTVAGSNNVISVSGTPYVTIEDLRLRNAYTSNASIVQLTGGSHYATVRNNVMQFTSQVTSGTTANLLIGPAPNANEGDNEANYALIEDNQMTYGYYGVKIVGSSSGHTHDVTVQRNTLRNNYYYGIYNRYVYDVDYLDNDIRNSGYTYSYGGYFYYCNNTDLRRNKINNSGRYGIYVAAENYSGPNSGSRSRYYNNFIGGPFGNYGYGVYGAYFTSVDDIDFYHNTVYMEEISTQNSSTTSNGPTVVYVSSFDGNMKNNIFYHAGSNKDAQVVYERSGSTVNWDYNMYYSDNFPDNIWTEGNASSPKFTYSEWIQADPLNNENSLNDQAQFINPAAFDFHLPSTYNVPTGEGLNIDLDVDRDIRCEFASAIGADESNFPLAPVIAEFATADTIYASSPTRLINTTSGDADKMGFRWYVDGQLEGLEADLKYTFNSTGTYTVSFVAANCDYSDSTAKQVTVVAPTSTPVADFVAETQVVEMFGSVKLFDVSKFGPTGWTWSANPSVSAIFDNQFSDEPTVSFFAPGYYEICLSAENSFGTGRDTCKTAYILVKDDINMCQFTNNTTKSPQGVLHDEGGSTGDYTNNKNCSILIDPCASEIGLTFRQVDLSDGGDRIRIYDGVDNTGNLLASVSGPFNGIPGGANGYTANSGKMYIEWTTNGSGTASGWTADYTSVPDGTPAPQADFTFPDTVFTEQEVRFTSTSTGGNLEYSWDFDPPFFKPGKEGGKKDFDRYDWNNAGTFEVQLSVSNCGGTSTIKKQVTVIDPSTAPVVGFVSDKVRVPIQGSAQFTDTSFQGPTSWRWEVIPSTGVIFPNGNTVQNPEIQFNYPGMFDVKLVATNSVGSDSVVSQQYIEVYNYCNPAVANLTGDIGISRVKFATIDNSSDVGVDAYTNYMDAVPQASLTHGGVYTIELWRNSTTNSMNRKVWIDYNIDGDFDDPGELVAEELAAKTLHFTEQIRIPRNANAGNTRMRIGTSYSTNNNSPCGINPVGEFEDYSIAIAPDEAEPMITLNGTDTVYIEQWYQYQDDGATAMDLIDGNLDALIVSTSNVDSSVVGTYQVNYNVMDTAGNVADQATRTVIVTPDVTDPVITMLGNAIDTLTVNTQYMDPGATASDYFNRNITPLLTSASTVDSSVLGTYEVTYTVDDGAGNIVSVKREVRVVDNLAPSLTLQGTDTAYVEVGNPYVEAGFNVSDNFDPSVPVNVTPSNVNTAVTGTTVLTYSATDAYGNSAVAQTRVVIVRDTEAPVMNLNGLDTVYVNVFDTYNEFGVKVSDNYCENLSAEADIYPNTNMLGDYVITYSVTDCEGNAATPIQRVVRVVDRVAPVMNLNGLSTITLQRWETFNDPFVTIYDNYYSSTELADDVQITTDYQDGIVEGEYEYCYTLTDPSGNVANRVCRTIIVEENTTGLQQSGEATISVYPNPSSGKFTIDAGALKDKLVSLEVYDVSGRRVATYSANQLKHSAYGFDLGHAAPGVYTIRVVTEQAVITKKVEVVR